MPGSGSILARTGDTATTRVSDLFRMGIAPGGAYNRTSPRFGVHGALARQRGVVGFDGLTIRTLSLVVVPLGLLTAACADSPTSPSSASTVEKSTGKATTAITAKAGTAGTGANGQPLATAGYALRFQATPGGEMGRVRIPIEPQVPLDVANDFTLELWIKAEPGGNAGGSCQAGEDGWRYGNVIIDRNLTGPPDNGEYGLSLSGGRLAFGVATTRGSQTICGLIDVTDGRWHHVAATRRAADGQLRIYVDGTESAQGTGPTGDVSYRDGRESADQRARSAAADRWIEGRGSAGAARLRGLDRRPAHLEPRALHRAVRSADHAVGRGCGRGGALPFRRRPRGPVHVQRAGQFRQQHQRPVPSGRHGRAHAGLRHRHAVQHRAGEADDEADVAAGRRRGLKKH